MQALPRALNKTTTVNGPMRREVSAAIPRKRHGMTTAKSESYLYSPMWQASLRAWLPMTMLLFHEGVALFVSRCQRVKRHDL